MIQWLQSQREHQLGLLLGEKETASYQSSDRARMQVYRALDSIPERHQREVVALRDELRESAHPYGDALDVGSFEKRLGQLEHALPWVAAKSPGRLPSVSAHGQE
jgi:hypothetical protein